MERSQSNACPPNNNHRDKAMDDALYPAADSLSRSRFSPPLATADDLARPRLDDALSLQPQARLAVLCAPAGFGKTCALTALAQARSDAGGLVVWLSLDAEDDEPGHFFQHLIDALAAQVPGLGIQARSYLHNTVRIPVAAVMESLLVELAELDRPLLLVLDDFHLIQDSELLSALDRLISLAPAGFLLAVGSRSQPGLRLATWRAKGLLVEIGEQTLRLSKEETRDYLQRHGLQLDATALAALYRHTEGWLIGVHLACLWLRQQPQAYERMIETGTDQAAVGDYLLRAVFEQLPADRQDLLLALGIAQQLCGDLANTLSGRQDGQRLLEELEALQLFLLPLDRERQWYRFHNLFAEFLRARLKERDPERFKHLHFNASLWFANHHMHNLAIDHACLADDPQMLAALVDGCGLELINRGQLHLIYKWRKRVPDDIAEAFPVLVLADVWTRAAELGLPEANRMLDELLERWGDAGASGPLSDKLLSSR